MSTAVIEIKNNTAYDLLKNLERMRIIRIVSNNKVAPQPKQKLSERFAGCLNLTDKQYLQMQNELTQMRNEWERNIY